MKGTAIACNFMMGLQPLAVYVRTYICTYQWGMHSKLLKVCCANTIHDQVMYLRSDSTAIAMKVVKNAAARLSDSLWDLVSSHNCLQTSQADTQPEAVPSGSAVKQCFKTALQVPEQQVMQTDQSSVLQCR